MFGITDTEVMLMGSHNALARRATSEINKANAEIRRLRALLARAEVDLDDERSRRQAAEAKLRRH